MHAAGVELHDAVGVGTSSVAYRGVLGVKLNDVNPSDERLKYVRAGRHHLKRRLDASQRTAVSDQVAVTRGHNYGLDRVLSENCRRLAEGLGR